MSAICRMLCCFFLLTNMSGCKNAAEELPKGTEVASATAPDRLSRGFVWMPEMSSILGATNSQPYQVWIQYLGDGKPRSLILKASATDGVRLSWRDIRTLEVCYGPSHISYFHNFFEYGGQSTRQLYSVEVILKRVQKLGDCS